MALADDYLDDERRRIENALRMRELMRQQIGGEETGFTVPGERARSAPYSPPAGSALAANLPENAAAAERARLEEIRFAEQGRQANMTAWEREQARKQGAYEFEKTGQQRESEFERNAAEGAYRYDTTGQQGAYEFEQQRRDRERQLADARDQQASMAQFEAEQNQQRMAQQYQQQNLQSREHFGQQQALSAQQAYQQDQLHRAEWTRQDDKKMMELDRAKRAVENAVSKGDLAPWEGTQALLKIQADVDVGRMRQQAAVQQQEELQNQKMKQQIHQQEQTMHEVAHLRTMTDAQRTREMPLKGGGSLILYQGPDGKAYQHIVPPAKPEPQMPEFSEGQGLHDIWHDQDTGAIMHRDPKTGQPKVMLKPGDTLPGIAAKKEKPFPEFDGVTATKEAKRWTEAAGFKDGDKGYFDAFTENYKREIELYHNRKAAHEAAQANKKGSAQPAASPAKDAARAEMRKLKESIATWDDKQRARAAELMDIIDHR